MWLDFAPSLFLFSSVIYYTYLWHNPEVWVRLVAPGDPAVVMSKVPTSKYDLQASGVNGS